MKINTDRLFGLFRRWHDNDLFYETEPSAVSAAFRPPYVVLRRPPVVIIGRPCDHDAVCRNGGLQKEASSSAFEAVLRRFDDGSHLDDVSCNIKIVYVSSFVTFVVYI